MIICSLLLFTSFFGGNQTNNLDRVKDMGLGLTNEYIVSQYAWRSLTELGRVKSVEDVVVLYDFAERIGAIQNRIIPNYRRMQPIIGIRFASDAERKRHERRMVEDGLQVALRDAKKIMTFMVIAQCDSSFVRERGTSVWTNILNGVAERAKFSEYERKCLLEFHARGEYPRDEAVYQMEMLTDEEMKTDGRKELRHEAGQ